MKSLYLQLDWLIPQFIEEYIPLSVNQEQELKRRLQNTLRWHRQTQLPEYVNWLRTFQKEIPRGLSEAQVLQHYRQLELFWKTLLIFMADDTAALLFSTNNEQRAHLFKTFENKNEDFRKKYIEPEEEVIHDNLLVQISDEYIRWLGHLEPAQQALIHAAIKKLQPTAALHLQNRLVLQHKLKTILNSTTSSEQLKSEIKNLFSSWEQLRSDKYQGTLQYNQAIMVKLTSDISATLNADQKNYFTQKTEFYITLFNELSLKHN